MAGFLGIDPFTSFMYYARIISREKKQTKKNFAVARDGLSKIKYQQRYFHPAQLPSQ